MRVGDKYQTEVYGNETLLVEIKSICGDVVEVVMLEPKEVWTEETIARIEVQCLMKSYRKVG